MGFVRLLLAISVLVAHSEPFFIFSMAPAEVAVQAFFIISGFYMALVLNTKYIDSKSNWLFITNRFLRLYPLYWSVLILTLVVSVLSGYIMGNYLKLDAYVSNGTSLNIFNWIFLFVSHIIIIGQEVILFLGLKSDGFYFVKSYLTTPGKMAFYFMVLPQAWSISLELLFYLIAPFIVRSKKTILIVFVLSLMARIISYYYLDLRIDPWTYPFFPFELTFFLLGATGFFLYKQYGTFVESKVLSYVVLLLVVTFISFYDTLPIQNEFKAVLFYSFFTLSVPILFLGFKNYWLDREVGEYSYPFYLIHVLAITFSSFVMLKCYLPKMYQSEIPFIITILTSWLLTNYIVKPIEKIRSKRVIARS